MANKKRVQTYLSPSVDEMYGAEMSRDELTESELGSQIIKKYYASLTEFQRKSLLAEYENVKQKYERKRGAHKKI